MLPIHDLHPAIHTIYHHLFRVRNSQNPAESSRIIPTSPRSRLVPSNRHRGIAPWSPRSPPRTARRRRRRRHRGRCLRCRAAAGSAAANSPPRRPGILAFPKIEAKARSKDTFGTFGVLIFQFLFCRLFSLESMSRFTIQTATS